VSSQLAEIVIAIEAIYQKCADVKVGMRPSVVLFGIVSGIIAKHEGDASLDWMIDAMKKLKSDVETSDR